MKRLKKIASIICFSIVALILGNNPVSALHYTEVPSNIAQQRLINTITYVEGGSAPFSENGITYYSGGNIIELSIALPANAYSIGVTEIVTYDQSQLELITSFSDIRNTLSPAFTNANWSSYVSKYNGADNQIMVVTSANNYHNSVDVTGGTVAAMRFRVKEQSLTTNGTNININLQYNIAGVKADGTRTYIHAGYNPANDNGTYLVAAPSITLAAHKTQVVVTPPVEPKPPTPKPTPSQPDPVVPSQPYEPDIEYHPDIVKEIVEEAISEEKSIEIMEVIKTKEYSFDALDERLSGRNTFQKIIQLFIGDKKVDTDKYKSFSFAGNPENEVAAMVQTHITCYVHYIFIGLSFLMLIATYVYKKYLETRNKVLWRNS